MMQAEYSLSMESKGLISEFLQLENLEKELMAEIESAENERLSLQRTEIRETLTPAFSENKESASQFKVLTEKITELDGRIEACQMEKAACKQKILASMEADKNGYQAKLQSDLDELEKHKRQAEHEFISALAKATVAQMRVNGYEPAGRRTWPHLSRGEEERFKTVLHDAIEADLAEAHIDSEYVCPAQHCTELEGRIHSASVPVAIEQVEIEIEKARPGSI